MPRSNSKHYARWLLTNSVSGIAILAALAAGVSYSIPVCLFWAVTSYALLAFAIVPRMRVADWLSASRVLLSCLAMICVKLGTAAWLPPALFALAIATDLADGYVARRTGATWHGARLDMEADQQVVLLLAVAVMEHTSLGVLALTLPGLKYLFTLLTSAARVRVGEVKPVRGDNRRARLIFVFVVAALFINLPSLPVNLPLPQGQATDAILLMAVVLLCGSFSSDWLYQWRRRWT
ncbi:MAG: CDP-alcohol phosphatidyltransferase family protein [Pseudomonadota bacterium]